MPSNRVCHDEICSEKSKKRERKVKNYLQFTIQWQLGSLRSRRALAIGVTYSMAIGAIRAIADRRRAWQAAVAVAVAMAVAAVTGLATGNGGRQEESRRVGGRWALGALGDVGIK